MYNKNCTCPDVASHKCIGWSRVVVAKTLVTGSETFINIHRISLLNIIINHQSYINPFHPIKKKLQIF